MAAISLTVESSFAQEKIERYSKGQINWTARQMMVTAKAPPYPDAGDDSQAQMGAELAAKQDIWHNYMDLLVNVRFNSSQSVQAFLDNHHALKYRVRAILRNYRQSGRKIYKDNSVEVSSYFSLDESFIQVLLSDFRFLEPSSVKAPSGQYSGIIIDGRGHGLKPALLPKIRQNGEVIWDTLQAASLWNSGPLLYAKDKSAAVTARVGERPLEIKILQSFGSYPVDMVVGAEEGEKLKTKELMEHLASGRLAVLVD